MTSAGRGSRSAAVWRLLVAAVVVGLLAACGATVVPSAPLPPTASSTPPTAPVEPTPPTDDTTQPPTDAPDVEPGAEYELPVPICPPPSGPIAVPDVLVTRVGSGDDGVIATRGSTTFATCTTTSSTDVVGDRGMPVLSATRQDTFVLRIEDGWSILRVEGFDGPAVGDGGNIQAPIDTPEGRDHVEVPAPQRDGDARAAWVVYLVRADGRAVGMVTVSIVVRLAPAAP